MNKNIFKILILVLICSSLLICQAFAADDEQQVPSLSVGEQIGSAFYDTEGGVYFNISASGIELSEETCTIKWSDAQPDGIEWKLCEDRSVILFSVLPTDTAIGEYPFRIVCDGVESNETAFLLLSKSFPIPMSNSVFEYDSEKHSVIDRDYNFKITGTAFATDAGEYSAIISLPDGENCKWEDGSTEPISVSFTITPRTVTVSGIKAVSKLCDGTDYAELDFSEAVFDGVVEGDCVSCRAEGTFENPKVGGGKKVFIKMELNGTDSKNYVLSDESQKEAFGSVYRCTESGMVECVTNPADNFRNGSVTETDEEFLDIIMNSELKTLVKNGADLKVWLSVSDITESAPEYDVNRVNCAKGDSTVAAYLDINIFRQFENEDTAVKIPEIQDEITIELDMPKSMINNNRDVTRTYKLIRVHNGVAETINVDYDAKSGVLRFNTDRFSTYALAFTDVDKPFSPAVVFANDGNYSVLWVIGFILLASKVYGVYLHSDAYEKRKKSAYQGRH